MEIKGMNNLFESEAKELLCPHLQDICRGQACIQWRNIWFDRKETQLEFIRISKLTKLIISLLYPYQVITIRDKKRVYACERKVKPNTDYLNQYMQQLELKEDSEIIKIYKIVDPIGYCRLGFME